GTGLGLTISRAIVIAHGGRMWVADNPPGGAAFTFELPASDLELSSEGVSDAGASARGGR
ncbi:MAG TPA: ATP-binding protein, partial [Actinomycetota bacterium]|nr:ATP-binding protein [Actinomycetota bacterium]